MRSLQSIGDVANLLDKQLTSLEGLRSLPWHERQWLLQIFKGESIHLGPPRDWLNRKWEFRVASVRGTIYKIALESSARDKDDAVSLSTEVFMTIQKTLGPPTEERDGLIVWDADDGNAILQLANVAGDRRIMLFLTSRIVRTFARR